MNVRTHRAVSEPKAHGLLLGLAALVSSIALLLSLVVATPSEVAAQDDTVTMTLLHNNDGESKLLPDTDAGFPGIARFSQLLQDLGTSTDADILLRVTSGDNFLASKEFAAGLARPNRPLYDSVALSGLYEAMALGNHDFDFGPDVTARFIEGFEPPLPFLASNIDVSDEPALAELADAGLIGPSTIVADSTSGLEVGVIGAVTPRLPNISSPRNVTVSADVAGAVNREVERLEEQGINRIVLISHLQSLTEDKELVPLLSGVDVVVAGGGDELLKNPSDSCQPGEDAADTYPLRLTDADGNEVPVVTGPGGYRCIGRLEVTFDGNGRVIDAAGEAVGVPLDGEAEQYAVREIEEPLAEALEDLSSTVIGTSAVDLDGQKPAIRTGPTNLGELLAASLLAVGLDAGDFGGPAADVAIQNGGGIRNDSVIPAGDLTLADTFDVAPFGNFVVTVEVPRDRFKDLLEVGVSGLPDAEGVYPQIAGFSMTVDPDAPAREVDVDGDCSLTGDEGSRVRSVTLDDGTVIVDDGEVVDGDPVSLATIDFLARGGDCYPLDDLEFTALGVSYQQALAQFIEDELDGTVDASEWAEGGSRTSLEPGAAGSSDDTESDSSDSDDPPAEDDSSDADPADDDADADEELPRTGLDTWLWLIVAMTGAAAGWLVWHEATQASLRSLRTRLATTRAWSPDDSRE